MPKAKVVFTVFAVLFELLYALMMWMFFAELEGETDPLARNLDLGILALGAVFMILQGVMAALLWRGGFEAGLKKLFYSGLVVWFFLEVVLSYIWCFVTGADPLTEHTPFVVIFLLFNLAQFFSLKRLGIVGASDAS